MFFSESYEKARARCRQAEDTSDVGTTDTDAPVKRRRIYVHFISHRFSYICLYGNMCQWPKIYQLDEIGGIILK